MPPPFPLTFISNNDKATSNNLRKLMEQLEEGKKLEAPVLFRLFGVEVRGGDGDEEATLEEEDGSMELKKTSSMPNLTSIDPLLQAGRTARARATPPTLLFQLPNPQSVAIKPASTQEIIHTDRGDVPVPSYPDAVGLRGNNMQVDELTDYVKRSKVPAEMSASSLELSIAPPRGAVEAIKVL